MTGTSIHKLSVDWGGLGPDPETPACGPFNCKGLEIGGGPHPMRPTCTQLDIRDWSSEVEWQPWFGPTVVGDCHELPFADESFGYVFASNLLEHFPPTETADLLAEWTRVLTPYGELELVVPDCMGILREYFAQREDWRGAMTRLLGGTDEERTHHTAFTLTEFPEVIAQVSELELVICRASHGGCGVHSISVKI